MLKSRGCLTCLRARPPIYGARLFSVSRQVGAHLWYEGPAEELSGIWTHNLSTLACLEVPQDASSTTESLLLLYPRRCMLFLSYAVNYWLSQPRIAPQYYLISNDELDAPFLRDSLQVAQHFHPLLSDLFYNFVTIFRFSGVWEEFPIVNAVQYCAVRLSNRLRTHVMQCLLPHTLATETYTKLIHTSTCLLMPRTCGVQICS